MKVVERRRRLRMRDFRRLQYMHAFCFPNDFKLAGHTDAQNESTTIRVDMTGIYALSQGPNRTQKRQLRQTLLTEGNK